MLVLIFSLDLLTIITILQLRNQTKQIIVGVKSIPAVTQVDEIHKEHATDEILKMKDTNVKHSGFYSALQ